jgi:hypothetical protein
MGGFGDIRNPQAKPKNTALKKINTAERAPPQRTNPNCPELGLPKKKLTGYPQ